MTLSLTSDQNVSGCIGLFVETGGAVGVTYSDGSADTLTVQDGTILPGLFSTVVRATTSGGTTSASGIHALY